MEQKKLFLFLILFTVNACIPYKTAPIYTSHKIVKGKRFQKGLPKRFAFVFNDPKKPNEFYEFITKKFKLGNHNDGWDIPIQIEGENYYLNFYEVERVNRTINLIPIALDVIIEPQGETGPFENLYDTQAGDQWYIVIYISNNSTLDCLTPKNKDYNQLISYLEKLRIEYLNTGNYESLLFK